jgi:hypothetical protein
VRAQQRLALKLAQQQELRELADLNASKLAALRRRQALLIGEEQVRAGQRETAALQCEFRAGLAAVLSPAQLAEWDTLMEELLGEVRRHDAPLLAGRQH